MTAADITPGLTDSLRQRVEHLRLLLKISTGNLERSRAVNQALRERMELLDSLLTSARIVAGSKGNREYMVETELIPAISRIDAQEPTRGLPLLGVGR